MKATEEMIRAISAAHGALSPEDWVDDLKHLQCTLDALSPFLNAAPIPFEQWWERYTKREENYALSDYEKEPARDAWDAALAMRSEKEARGWVEAEKAKADAYADAVSLVEKIAEDYTHEHGSYDSSTNAWELHHRHAEYIEALDDAVEAIRKRKAEKCSVTQAAK